VKSAIGKYEPHLGSDGTQLVLDGFEYLQKGYPVLRGTVRQLVPTDQITDEEWDIKDANTRRWVMAVMPMPLKYGCTGIVASKQRR